MEKKASFGAYTEYWLQTVVQGTVKPNTYTVYRGLAKNHLLPSFGETPLKALDRKKMQLFSRRLRDEKGLSVKTVRMTMNLLSQILRCAAEEGEIAENPCMHIRLPSAEEREVEAFSRGEQRKIEEAAVRSQDGRALGVLLCLYTGIRIGELCALKWENVNFALRAIEIKSTLYRVTLYGGGPRRTQLREDSPKTRNSARVIPLPLFLFRLLKKKSAETKSGYVICMKTGERVQPRTMQLVYGRLLREAGVPYKKFHALRHTFATRAVEIGVDVKTISDILGHCNAQITLNRYAHSLLEHKRHMMKNFDKLFEKTARVRN